MEKASRTLEGRRRSSLELLVVVDDDDDGRTGDRRRGAVSGLAWNEAGSRVAREHVLIAPKGKI